MLGFSVLEVVLSAAIFLLVIGGVTTVFLHTQLGFLAQTRVAHLEQTGRRVHLRLTREIRNAEPSTVTIGSGGESVTFNQVTGYSGGSVQLSAPISFDFQLASGETANGKDDNGDGRVDEGILRSQDTAGAWSTITSDVLGVTFTSAATTLSFSVTFGAVDQREGEVVQRTFTETIALRN